MEDTAPRVSWTLLTLLDSRFSANLKGLSRRLPELAKTLEDFAPRRTYHILPTSDAIQLGVSNGPGITPIPHTLSPATAKDLVRRLFPTAHCIQPVLIAGEDMGWLWNSIYQLPCQTPAAPGHRPPLFFLIKDIERLWVILHIHDWRNLLADHRVRLFIGDNAMQQFRQSLIDEPACPWPRISVRADPMVWSGNPTLDEILAEAQTQTEREFLRCTEQARTAYARVSVESIAAQLRGGQPLKILGVASRFTSSLQYSMRDWLKSFERLGHCTRMVVEEHDHQICSSLSIASACAEFQPDLIVTIDHYRQELGGMPERAPVVMWVQNALPGIFRREAGAAQGPLDYAMGFARMRMIHEFGYPGDRYMPAVVGCDEERFRPQPVSMQEQGAYGCDVSFVSNASTPPDALLSSEIDRAASRESSRLLHAIFDQLCAVYEGGGVVTEPAQIQRMIDLAIQDAKATIADAEMPRLMDLFHRINNAMFRHQSLHWLAEMGMNLRLYGRGWEKHPTLSRFARGVAENANQLSLIYRASRISLQISPHGAVQQRVMEGLAAGGFFLIRYSPGDLLERHFQQIWNWCASKNIMSDSQLRHVHEPHVASALTQVADGLKMNPFASQHAFIDTLRASAQSGYIRSAGTVWGEDYDAVVYRSASELRAKVEHFLADEYDRRRISESMRHVVLARFTYAATTRRLMNFIADDLAAQVRQRAAA